MKPQRLIPFCLMFAVVTTATAQQWTTNTLPPDVVAWWQAEGNFADLVGANPGTAGAGVSFTSGQVGNAFRFVNSPDSTIRFPSSPAFAPTNRQLTITAWIKPDFTSPNTIDTILEQRDECGTLPYSFIFSVLKAYPGYPPAVFGLGMLPQIGYIASTNRVPDDGQFHHVAVTYNGYKAEGNCVLYLDGQIVGGGNGVGPIPAQVSGPVMGLHQCLSANSSMAIDEVGFFARELSAAEIACLAGEPQGPVDFSDDFSTGVNSNVWRVGSSDPRYSLDASQGDIRFSRQAGGDYSIQTMVLAFDREVRGDFDASVDFRDASINRADGSPGNQVQLVASFGGQAIVVVRSDEAGHGHNAHVWRNPPSAWTGEMATAATSGTFRIARVGAVVNAYYNGTVLHSGSYNTAPVTQLYFHLQNNGTRDAISVAFDNFHLKADRLVPKPAQLQSLGLAGNEFKLRLVNPTPGAWHWVEFAPSLPGTDAWSVRGRIVGSPFPANWSDVWPLETPAGFYRVRSQ